MKKRVFQIFVILSACFATDVQSAGPLKEMFLKIFRPYTLNQIEYIILKKDTFQSKCGCGEMVMFWRIGEYKTTKSSSGDPIISCACMIDKPYKDGSLCPHAFSIFKPLHTCPYSYSCIKDISR